MPRIPGLQARTAAGGAVLILLGQAVAAPAVAATAPVAVASNFFSPATVILYAGDSVQWTNTGGFHNASAEGGQFRCANGCDGNGGNGAPASAPWVATLAFFAPAQIPYQCEIHGPLFNMKGTVIVQRSIFDDGFESALVDEWVTGGVPGDNCGTAMVLTPPVVGMAGHLHGAANDLDLTLDASCLAASARGRDRIYQVAVPSGHTLNATVTPTSPGFDPAIYLISSTGCSAEPLLCLDGANAGAPGASESVSYQNATGSAVTVLLVVDSVAAATAGSEFTLDASIL